MKDIEFRTKVILQILILFVLIILLNFIVQKFFSRLDLTADKSYTISDVTKKMLKELDDVVNINVYFSEKLPPELMSKKEEIEDLLKEYQAYSKDKIKISFIDPAKDAETKSKVQQMGIPEVQMNVYDKDELKVIQGFLGLGIFYGNKQSVIPVVQDTRNLEYELTTGIRKVTTDELQTIGFLTGHNEKDIYNDYATLRSELEKQYKIEPVILDKGKNPVPDKITVLVIAGPKEKFTAREKYEIDQYLMKGGKIIFLIDTVNISEQLYAQDIDVNIDDLLNCYGVRLEKNLVLDKLNEAAAFRTGFVQFVTPYPYFIKLIKTPKYSSFSEEHPITAKLDNITFMWVSSVDTGINLSDKKYTSLVHSSPESWQTKGYYNLNPQTIPTPSEPLRSYNLAVIVEGKFRSLYADTVIPAVENADTGWKDSHSPQDTKKMSDTNFIMVVADSDFIDEDNIKRNRGNLAFFLNTVDWFSLDKDMITIRSRGIISREIKPDLEEHEKNIIKFVNIGLVPLVVIIFGIVRYVIKRRRRKEYLA